METTTIKKLKTLESRIENCLEAYTDARNSDIDLFARVCQRFYPPFERPLYSWTDLAYAMHQVPSLDHIARIRRIIIRKNNYKKYLPTDPNIARHRGLNYETWLEYAKNEGIELQPALSNVPVEWQKAEGNDEL